MPPVSAHALTRPLFTDQDFAASKFSSAAEKAWFGNALLRFIEADFPRSLWTKRLYKRLSLCFGHIACTNIDGFWSEFYGDLQGKVSFLKETLAWPCYGQPDYTYCDVERAIQARLHASDILAIYRAARAAEVEGAERALLAQLRAKYDGISVPTPVVQPVAPRSRQQVRRNTAPDNQPNLL